MIKNHSALADHIGNWIKNYVASAKQKGVVLGLSGGIDSALVALLCKHAGVPLYCVNMPCHSSSAAYDRAAAFASDFDLFLAKVDLSEVHQRITGQFIASEVIGNNASYAALRSCLRAPTLSYYAHSTQSLIIGTGNRSEDRITRYFQKFGDGCVDFSPIADLFKSEVYDLFSYLATDYGRKEMPVGAKAIFEAIPTADLGGPSNNDQADETELGLTYDEIEWGDRQDIATSDGGRLEGIVFSENSPRFWNSYKYSYNERQRVIIDKLHQMEKVSRHKSNPNQPVCVVRNTEFVD